MSNTTQRQTARETVAPEQRETRTINVVPKQLLSKREVAGAVGTSPRTIDNWVAQKRIPYLRLSSRLTRFNLPKVLAALARYEVKEVGAQ